MLAAAEPLADPPGPPERSQPAFIQFSSGSTSSPKGCVLTGGAVAAQLQMLAEALEVDAAADQGAVWLPLSHDMGMFGCLLLSFWTRHPVAISTPQRFIRDPWTWITDAAAFGATLSAQPSFALDLVARIAGRRQPPELRLRHVVVGGDVVSAGTLRRTGRALGEAGLPARALCPAYGLAEATLAVTMTRPADLSEGHRSIHVDRRASLEGELIEVSAGAADARELLSNGRALPGVALHVDGDLPLGPLWVDGPCMAVGHVGVPDGDRWGPRGFATGDLGAVVDGELYVAGRSDDVLIVGGRNVSAADAEVELQSIEGVRRGSAALVQRPSDRRLVAVLEWTGAASTSDRSVAVRAAARTVRDSTGSSLAGVVLVEPKGLPKTPSGKLQRFRCRELAEGEGPQVLARLRP